ncbi:MAG: hydantoinase/oxoprolinase family protein [Xenophilus sp.]
MSYQVCIDIGGTFTDCLVADEEGRIEIHKAPTTPGEFHRGFIDVLHVAAEARGLSPADFIRRIELILHGSTVSTNALVERKTSRVGLILNEGHADVLTLREGPRKGAFEWKLDYPEPYVPRRLTRTVRGRIDARGRELVPLDEAAVIAAAREFRALGVEAIAVGLLWSVANAGHERRVRELIAQEWPDVPVTLSHEVNPMAREYKRIIAAAIDASINPIIRRYLGNLQGALTAEGFKGELLLANCVGGMMPPTEMMRRPIYSVMSGPTLAPMAALALTDHPDVVVGDMGGTTFDVSALRAHQLIVTPEATIHDDALGIPKVDVRSVGAGGGSIAHVDAGGLLHVGPHSAGARPGPACYGRGGEHATVTDANIVLGIIDPDFFLGGRIQLDRSRAEAAVDRIAEQLSVSRDEAAHAIWATSNHNMVGAIEDITINEGLNPRESYFVCGGGATACHIAEMADVLGLTRYLIPRFMAGLSAFGGLISDIRFEENGALLTDSTRFDIGAVNALLQQLKARGEALLDEAGIAPELREYEFVFLGRYEFQSWELEVRIDECNGKLDETQVAQLVEAFHRMHERVYSIRTEENVVEFTTWRVRAIGRRPRQHAWKNYTLEPQQGPVLPARERSVYLRGPGRRMLPVYDTAKLGAGAVLPGPCLAESATFTALLLDGHDARIDAHGNLDVTVRRSV